MIDEKRKGGMVLALSPPTQKDKLGAIRFLRKFSRPTGRRTDRKLSRGALGGYYCTLARQAKAMRIGRQALHEIHSALSGPSPDCQRMGRSG
mgnify:CR=1 FL=1